MSDEDFATLPAADYFTPQGDCRISARPAGHILQILAPPFASGVASALNEAMRDGANAVRSAGPGVWYFVGDAPLTPEDVADRKARLGPQVYLVDQTDGRVRIELSGRDAAHVLATGTAVDLSLARFPIGSACETMFGHIGIHLTRIAADRFELLVGRSYAMNLWEEMTTRNSGS